MKQGTIISGLVCWLSGIILLAQPGVEAGETIGPAGFDALAILLVAIFSMVLGSLLLARNFPHIEPLERFTLLLLVLAAGGVWGGALGGSIWLDDDLYRYVWDGALSAAGISPHTVYPALAGEIPVSEGLYQRLSYKNVVSVYPPLATWWLELQYRIFGENILLWLQMNALLTIAGLGLTLQLCVRAAAPRWLMILILLNPMWAKEFGDSGHIDILAYDLVMAGLLLSHRPGSKHYSRNHLRVLLSGCLLGLAIMVKPLAVIWLIFYPYLAFPQRLVLFSGALLVSLAACSLYFQSLADLRTYWQSLRFFADHWVFNPGFADLLRGGLTFWSGGQPEENWTTAIQVTRALASAFLVLSCLIFITKDGEGSGTLRLWAMGIFFSLMPVFNPWYLVFLWPAMAYLPWKKKPATAVWSVAPFYFMVLQGFMGYTYWAALEDYPPIRLTGWLAFYACALFSLWRIRHWQKLEAAPRKRILAPEST